MLFTLTVCLGSGNIQHSHQRVVPRDENLLLRLLYRQIRSHPGQAMVTHRIPHKQTRKTQNFDIFGKPEVDIRIQEREPSREKPVHSNVNILCYRLGFQRKNISVCLDISEKINLTYV